MVKSNTHGGLILVAGILMTTPAVVSVYQHFKYASLTEEEKLVDNINPLNTFGMVGVSVLGVLGIGGVIVGVSSMLEKNK